MGHEADLKGVLTDRTASVCSDSCRINQLRRKEFGEPKSRRYRSRTNSRRKFYGAALRTICHGSPQHTTGLLKLSTDQLHARGTDSSAANPHFLLHKLDKLNELWHRIHAQQR